jgi:hypothetical protein
MSSVKMYKSRIWKWGLDKKLKGDEVLAILLLKRERDSLDKASEFRIRGQVVDLDNINRYLKRNPSLMARYRAGQMPSMQTTLEVDCRTPSPSPTRALAPPQELQNAEAVLALFRDYVDGSFAAGAWNCEFDVDCVSSRSVRDRSNDLFERVIASFALVNRCMMRGDKINISSMLDPSFESLKEIVGTESPVFVARTVCLLWYLERHHKHDLLRLVLNYLTGLVPIVLGQHHIMTHIWRRLGNSEFSDYYELSMRLYALLLPEIETRIGSANYLTHVLYNDYVDCIYARQGPQACESVIRTHRTKAEASGKSHSWLRELALSHAGLLAAVKEREGRLDEAVQVLASFKDEYPLTEEHEASVNVEMGVYYYRMGNWEGSITCSKNAARLALTSDCDERVAITSLANLENTLREVGRRGEADRVLHFRMQRLAAFAERSVSLSIGADESEEEEDDDDDDDDDFEFESTAMEVEDLPDWLQITKDNEEESRYLYPSQSPPGRVSHCPNVAFEWSDMAAAKSASSVYSTGQSRDASRRSSYVPPGLPAYAQQGGVSPQGYSPYMPPGLSPAPESQRKNSYYQPILSPRPESGNSPYYGAGVSPQPERASPFLAAPSPQPDPTNPYYAPGLSPQPEDRAPYFVNSPQPRI